MARELTPRQQAAADRLAAMPKTPTWHWIALVAWLGAVAAIFVIKVALEVQWFNFWRSLVSGS